MHQPATTLEGIVRGKTIELEGEPGFPEGQRVRIEIRAPEAAGVEPPASDEPPAWLERLDVDPGVRPRKLVIKGTRLLVEDLVRLVEEGRSDEDLLRRHPELAPEDVGAIRQYARAPAGLRSSFGGWAEDAEELDEYLEWCRRQRKVERREIEP